MRSFELKLDKRAILDKLTCEQVGKLFKAIYDYAETGKERDLGDTLNIAFWIFKVDIDNYEKKNPSGSNHWNWQGGISKENHSIRNSTQYKQWREDILERDDYTCQKCGKRGGKLNVHHIEKFSINKEKRFNLDNGITLCEKCHKEVHKNEG